MDDILAIFVLVVKTLLMPIVRKKKYLHEPLLEFTLSFEELYLGVLITIILEVS